MDIGELRERIQWLNTEGGFEDAISDDAIIKAAEGVSHEMTDKILQELESKKDSIKNPTSWVSAALRKEKGQVKRSSSGRAAPMMMSFGGGAIDEEMKKVSKRINWLNGKGGFENSLVYDKVIAAAGGLPFSQVLDVLKELENKRDGVKDPNAWVCAALRKGGGGGQGFGGQGPPPSAPYPMAHQAAWQPPPPAWAAPPPPMHYGGGPPSGGRHIDPEVDQKIRKRIRWLNENAGLSQELNYQKVSEAAVGLDLRKVLVILKEMEEIKGEVKDPTAFVTSKMRKAGGGKRDAGGGMGGGEWMMQAPPMQAPPASWGAPPPGSGWNPEAEAEDAKLRKRINWLNGKGGFNGAISYEKILEASGGLEFAEVFRCLKQLEEKRDTVKDPTGWVTAGLRKSAGRQQPAPGPPMHMMSPAAYGMPYGGPPPMMAAAGPMDRDTVSRLHKRIKWLNGNGGFNDAILFDKVKEAAEGVDSNSMMKVLKDLEEKKDDVKDPTAYVSSALRKLGGGGGGKGGPRGVMGVKRSIGKVKQERMLL